MCGKEWENRDVFLDDKALLLNGYSADFDRMEAGLFYFTHKIPGCFSTLALCAEEFLDLYKGQKYLDKKTNEKDCPKFCLERENLSRCPSFCEYAFVREVIQIILQRQKEGGNESVTHDVADGVYGIK